MTTYLKIDVETNEIYSRCTARDRRTACRLLGCDESNAHLYEVIAESRYRRIYGAV